MKATDYGVMVTSLPIRVLKFVRPLGKLYLPMYVSNSMDGNFISFSLLISRNNSLLKYSLKMRVCLLTLSLKLGALLPLIVAVLNFDGEIELSLDQNQGMCHNFEVCAQSLLMK